MPSRRLREGRHDRFCAFTHASLKYHNGGMDACRASLLYNPDLAIRFERPVASNKQFDVRIVFVDHYKSGFLVFAVLFLMSSVLLLLPHTAVGGALCMLFFGSLMLLSRRTYRRAITEPVVLEVYSDGLWFNRLGIFVPYERLEHSGTARLTTNGYLSMRLCRFGFLVTANEAKKIRSRHPLLAIDNLLSRRDMITVALPGQDGVLSPSHDKIVQTVKQLTHDRAHSNRQ